MVSVLILAGACSRSPQAASQPYANPSGQLYATPAAAQAQAQSEGWTKFTDPTENAFTVAVPQGWQIRGGVERRSPVVASLWIQASSPDGSASVFIGDPTVPVFALPTQRLQEGTQVSGAPGPEMVLSYQTGAQFAAQYGQRMFSSACANLQQTGGQSEPAVAQKAQADMAEARARVRNAPPVTTAIDAGSALFSCTVNGRPYVMGVIAATGLSHIGDGGIWTVPVLFGYRAPAERQGDADGIARTMAASLQKDPQWQQKMADATSQALALQNQQGAQAMSQLQQQEAQESAMLNQQYQNNVNAQNQRYNDFTAQQNGQRDARNEAFAEHEQQRDQAQQREMLYIQNRRCVEWYDAAHTSCRYYVDN